MSSPVERTPLYQLRKFAQGQPLADVGKIVNNHADTLEAALIKGGLAPASIQAFLSDLQAFVTFSNAGAFDDSGWQTLTLLNSANARTTDPLPRVRKIGKIVIAQGGWANNGLTASSVTTVANLPVGFAPTGGPIVVNAGMPSPSSEGRIIINTSGSVQLQPGATVPTYMRMEPASGWTVN